MDGHNDLPWAIRTRAGGSLIDADPRGHLDGYHTDFPRLRQGGAGAQFTDLPAAVAAVPDGAALIVRPGSYSPFAIAGKGIAIVGEGDGVVLASTSSATAASMRHSGV